MSGATLVPVAAANASPVDPTDACNPGNVLALDGMVGGLDRSEPSCSGAWDPNGSCGCIAADLGATYNLASITVYAAPAAVACATPCSGSNCNTGDRFSVLVGTEPDQYAVASDVSTAPAAALAPYTIAKPLAARFIVVCRQSWSSLRDDFVVDAVQATCQ